MKTRIGFGFDVHRLVEGRELWLCGIKLDYSKGLLGHSDADVALHALCDALLGAASMRDIGYHFPDSDDKYSGADSKVLLKSVMQKIKEGGYSVGNVDITICHGKTKIEGPYIRNAAVHSKRNGSWRRLRVGKGYHNGTSRLYRARGRHCRLCRGAFGKGIMRVFNAVTRYAPYVKKKRRKGITGA